MLKFIPITAQAGIVGFESPAAEYTELGLSLDSLLIDKPAATFIGYAQGKSMMDDGIHDGDLLIVSRAEDISDMCIVVATLNGEFVCKRVDKRHGCLRSSSPLYKPYFLKEGDEFSIEGVVTRSIRLHKKLSHRLGDE